MLIFPACDVRAGGHVLITDARISLARGRRYGLLGRNGHGKSTLLQAVHDFFAKEENQGDTSAPSCVLVDQHM